MAFRDLQWGVGVCDIQPTLHMCILYIAYMAFGDLQWGGVGSMTQKLSEPQNGHPAITARCSDHKWTSHNKGFFSFDKSSSCSLFWLLRVVFFFAVKIWVEKGNEFILVNIFVQWKARLSRFQQMNYLCWCQKLVRVHVMLGVVPLLRSFGHVERIYRSLFWRVPWVYSCVDPVDVSVVIPWSPSSQRNHKRNIIELVYDWPRNTSCHSVKFTKLQVCGSEE